MTSVQRPASHSSAGASSTALPSPNHASNHDKVNSDESTSTATPARQPPQLGQEGFWSPRIKAQRAAYLKGVGATVVLIMIIIWAVVAIYWGSVYKELDLSPNLGTWIINRDSGIVGSTVQQALLDANNGPKPHSTWTVIDPSRFSSQDQVDYEVTNALSTWMVVTVAEDATSKLEQARANGDASWNPQSLVSLTYATSRNFQVIPATVLSPAMETLNKALAQLGAQLAGEYLSTIASNQTAINNLARAPQTITQPIIPLQRDLRPYDVPVAIAVLVVGLIYLVILAFISTMANFGARQPLQPFLKFRSLVAMRIVVPLIAYFFISLMISLLNIPFNVPFGRTFSYGAGFMTWWCATFVGMCVFGFVTECFISIVGPKFIGFTLVFWIIINVSVANLPIELSPSFYRYGYSMPFYSIRQIYVKIIFDVGQRVEMLKWFGILWAWLAVILLTLPFWMHFERKTMAKAQQAQAKQKQQKEKPTSSS
ncbi:hypothetical protein PHSY_004966 [Pseudozyma hubeiensis SY62]|uniref:DUF3533 domain-containing protein n=1 Tax=Pseudozyma hubeiensis (strain SY62) TaxID=1305764 RepID=R9P7Q6_PSEHS|nr:hypothetical protein PHSY_004966 [Pseudozyma hubeiensis SY62]GAC97381.1 hypothetical protein PHSY_004966 [Pseudozyma hubeiensis SY62]